MGSSSASSQDDAGESRALAERYDIAAREVTITLGLSKLISWR